MDFTSRLHRGARASAVALIAASLTLAAGYAQGTSAPGPNTEGASTNAQPGQPDTGAATTTSRSDNPSTAPSSSYGASERSTHGSATAGTRAELKRSEKKFISEVAEGTPTEMAMAQLAIERASNPQIKTYAQQIISDHQQMSQELAQLAQSKGVALEHSVALSGSASTDTTRSAMSGRASTTTGVSGDTAHTRTTDSTSSGAASTRSGTVASTGSLNVPDEVKSDRHYRNLSQKSGAEFDREFVDMMVKDHQKDVKMFREQADKAEDSEVREFASKNVAVLQGHLDRAQTLNQSLAE
ncbi:DUF4142 domain-containing protein [Opitutus terrae]|nr:DUF4142 domain-containing protein [Opitutus terrae]